MFYLLKVVPILQSTVRCPRKRRIHHSSILAIIVECHPPTDDSPRCLGIWPHLRSIGSSMDNAHRWNAIYHWGCSGVHCLCQSAVPRGKDDKQQRPGDGARLRTDIYIRNCTNKDQRYRIGSLHRVIGRFYTITTSSLKHDRLTELALR